MIAMKRHGTKKLRYQTSDITVELEQQDSNPVVTQYVRMEEEHAPVSPAARQREIPPASGSTLAKEAEKMDAGGLFVTSPIVGTFYASASPDDAPYVQPGDKVTADTVVCIVEAMKVMNEVKAGVVGTVESILVDNGHPIEFGANLFRIKG
jgi:acetyl-CoA carboxylase biotin carboxyl carrier protein